MAQGAAGDVALYRGSCLLTVDDKGRIAVPTRFRDLIEKQCKGRLVVTMYFERGVVVFPAPAWKKLEQELQQLSDTRPAERALREMLLGHADDRQLDSQGRLLLAPALRKHAGLEREAQLIGQGNKLVLWSKAVAEQRFQQWDKAFADPDLSGALGSLTL